MGKRLISDLVLYKTWVGGYWRPPKKHRLDNDRGEAEFSKVIEAGVNRYGNFADVEGNDIGFFEEPFDEHPELGVYKLARGKVCFSSGAILSPNGNVFYQPSWYRGDQKKRFFKKNISKIQSWEVLQGTSISLCSEFAESNYGHFLLDGIGRLALYEKYNKALLDDTDHILVSGNEAAWKKKLLKRFGVPISKVKWMTASSCYECDDLYFTSFPGMRRSYGAWLCKYFRNKASLGCHVNKTVPKKRLFITRGGAVRAIKNEDQIFNIARSYGFEICRPEKSDDSIRDFMSAEFVIGAHGAGLSDVVFMERNSHVLELMPSDHRHCYFFTLGKMASLNYDVLVGRSDHNRWLKKGPSPYDFIVDPFQFESFLERKFDHTTLTR